MIGLSGAGKSTLIRCVNLLERPTSGSVTVDGQEMTRLSASALNQARHRIGMIFQHFNLLTTRNVYDNIALPLELMGMKRTAIRERVMPLLELTGLTDKISQYPAQLSGGQKQRVAIARAWPANRGYCCATRRPPPWTPRPPARSWNCCGTSIRRWA
ncbi:hypothetical protein Q427_31440 [Halomonas sp. BC04]|nr:hypothetical protein Q427_31440 [Halomonas sp. BC04]